MNTTKTRFLLGIAMVLMFSACDSSEENDGQYAFVLLDEQGVKMAEGTLELRFRDMEQATMPTVEISGGWMLDEDDVGGNHGLPGRSGQLEGSIDQTGAISINMNPQVADANVYLSGRFVQERYGDMEGQWNFSTLIGVVRQGVFRAVRN